MGYKLKRMLMWVNQVRLPAEYQEVEYIESSGTQYIKTGLNIYDGYRHQQKIRFLSAQSNYIISGGYLGRVGGVGRFYRFYFCGPQSNGQWSWGYLGDASGEPGHQQGGSGGSINTDYELDICWISGNAYYKVDGTALMTSTVTWSSNLAGECCLFGGYAQDSNPNYVPYPGGVRVYYSKFYDSNGVLVRDFVPCYRKSDNIIGMYDLVNNVFYTNDGTGAFTKGSDVPYMVEKQVRPNKPAPLSYDFTTSDAGWNANGCSRDSRGFYRYNTRSDGWIIGLDEIFIAEPKKITIVFNKVNQSSGIGLGRNGTAQDTWYALPMDYDQQQRLIARVNGSNTTYNLSAIPSGIVTWEMDVNTATTPRTVTHKITGLSDVTETSGVLDYMRSTTGNGPRIRIVNWGGSTGSMCIMSATFEY